MRLGSGLTGIGHETFLACRALERVDIPDGVREIGDAAFRGCAVLWAVGLPAGRVELGDSVFEGTAIETLSLPHALKRVGKRAFADCYRLTTVILPPSRVTLEKEVFAGCAGIELLVLPDRTLFLSRKLEKWQLTEDATVLRHAELRVSSLLAEYGNPDVTPERREELKSEIRAAMRGMKG